MAGISCSICPGKITRYDDKLICVGSCKPAFHPRCVNINEENFHQLHVTGALEKWTCNACKSKSAGKKIKS